jgi:hypothetical protein
MVSSVKELFPKTLVNVRDTFNAPGKVYMPGIFTNTRVVGKFVCRYWINIETF